jgi:GT2 family glycosyltransferase
MLGIVITVYGRYNHTSICFESVENLWLPQGTKIVIVDDGTRDKRCVDLINGFKPQNAKVFVIRNDSNIGVARSLQVGLDYAVELECDLLMNLDNDTTVKPDAVNVITKLHQRYQGAVVSGFNTMSRDSKTNRVRHPIIYAAGDHVRKKSIGGINMMFSKQVYKDFVRPSLLKNRGHWDWQVCATGIELYATVPSVVQHTGINGGMNMNNPDIAHDY